MKKIIELAEKYIHTKLGTEDPPIHRIHVWETFKALRSAIDEYKRLSETPITEDWLKEHGFKNERLGIWSNILRQWKDCDNFTHTIGVSVSSQNIYNTMEGELSLIINADSKGYLAKSINTLADLYDACELCEINLEV